MDRNTDRKNEQRERAGEKERGVEEREEREKEMDRNTDRKNEQRERAGEKERGVEEREEREK